MNRPIVYFFTDFGAQGPYLGQMETALLVRAPQARVINLLSDAPPFSPKPSAYLLGALLPWLAPESVLVGVVDPGVGTDRKALLLESDGRRFIGPDNGLFASLLKSSGTRAWEILQDPAQLSATFHGRDLFAPAAGRLLGEGDLERQPMPRHRLVGADWPGQLAEIIYIDHYGNAMSGLRAGDFTPDTVFRLGEVRLFRRHTFADVPPGEAFWYENSLGLVEVAVNRGRSDTTLGVQVGTPIRPE
ncbi:MAG: hypothetical protein DSZ00_10020 [Gammaproteobacteria bacterium]|nr:MAG: hypothetical protein DSZ00_10020 [Gammaproteobacteria bacterium]RTZ73116.1 MAG: hypothetical protein DSZ02_07845 [Gammaproteobacteria bacterium]RTZ79805.1 MAG: hypothetical protein DSZ01_03105 [Gammaproteobacteria bacterium]